MDRREYAERAGGGCLGQPRCLLGIHPRFDREAGCRRATCALPLRLHALLVAHPRQTVQAGWP